MADGVRVYGTRKGSASQKSSQRWPGRSGAGSCEASSPQLATHGPITCSGDLVLQTFPKEATISAPKAWRFPIFSFCFLFCALCHHHSALWTARGAALSVPLPPPHCIFLCESFLTPSTVSHHAVPQPLSNGHTKNTERDREKSFWFCQKKMKEENPMGKVYSGRAARP